MVRVPSSTGGSGDCYVEVARADPGRPLVLTEPISVTLDIATLVAPLTYQPVDCHLEPN